VKQKLPTLFCDKFILDSRCQIIDN